MSHFAMETPPLTSDTFPTPERVLLRTLEAAQLLDLDPKTVRKLAAAGRLPHVRLGRRLRFPKPALDAWLRDPRSWGAVA